MKIHSEVPACAFAAVAERPGSEETIQEHTLYWARKEPGTLLRGEPAVVGIGIDPALFQELPVGSLFCDSAGVPHSNTARTVRFPDGSEPVG